MVSVVVSYLTLKKLLVWSEGLSASQNLLCQEEIPGSFRKIWTDLDYGTLTVAERQVPHWRPVTLWIDGQCLGVTSRRWEARQVASIAWVTPATATQACVATLDKCFILSPVCCFAYFLINFSFFRPFLCLVIVSLFYNLSLSSSPILHSFLQSSFIYLHLIIYLSQFYFLLPSLLFSSHASFSLFNSSFFTLGLSPSFLFLRSLSVTFTKFLTSKISHVRRTHKHAELVSSRNLPSSGNFTDSSGRPIGPILGLLTLEDGTD